MTEIVKQVNFKDFLKNIFFHSEPFSDICYADDGLVSTVPSRHTKVCRDFFLQTKKN